VRQLELHSSIVYPSLLRVLYIASVAVLVILSPSIAVGQLTVQFEKEFEETSVYGIGNYTIDSAGNMYLVGYEYPSPSLFELTKVNRQGEIDWQRTFSGAYSINGVSTYSQNVEIDPNGDVVVAGISHERLPWPSSIDTAAQLVVVKYDSEGNLLWGSPASVPLRTPNYGHRLDLTIDGSGFIYVVAEESSLSDLDDYRVWDLTTLVVAGIDSDGSVVFSDARPTESFNSHFWPLRRIFASDSTARVVCRTMIDSLTCDEDRFRTEHQTSILKYSHSGYEEEVFGPWKAHSSGLDHSCNDHRGRTTSPRDVSEDIDGSLVIACQVYEDEMVNAILSVAEDGTLNWSTALPTDDVWYTVSGSDGSSYFSEGSPQWKVYKYNQSGDLIWTSAQLGPYFSWVVDRNDNLCVLDGPRIAQLNALDGTVDWSVDYGWEYHSICPFMGVDNSNRIYALNSYDGTRIGCYGRQKRFDILDATVSHSPLAERDIDLYAADPSQPGFVTGHIGTFGTDQNGAIEFSLSEVAELMYEDVGTGLEIGDLAAVSMLVKSATAPRHPIVLPTKYNVWLDPIKFDEYGIADLEYIDNQSQQEYVMDHTEYRYNLLVSVEWDADEVYLQGLQSEFQYMSNYLYDVTDGQVRLDTVVIFDDGLLWQEADVRIKATNTYTPKTWHLAIDDPNAEPIRMPRKWFGGARDRFLSDLHHPLGLAVSDNFRCLAHEFGHYALGFLDEYEFVDAYGSSLPESERCLPYPQGNYGLMDNYYADWGGEFASEMSSSYRYAVEDCQNTEQWVFLGERSCWDFFEAWAEGTFGNIYVPILKPDLEGGDERQTPEGMDYVPGPNNIEDTPDFNVGSLIEFPVPVTTPAEGIQSLHVHVPSASAGGVNVFLWKRDVGLNVTGLVDQGFTTDIGLIYVLGVNTFYDMIDASGRSWQLAPTASKGSLARSVERTWQVGDLDLSTGKSSLGMGASLSPAEDSVELSLYEVDGYFPMVCDASMAGGSVTYSIQAPIQPLPAEPEVELIPSHGGVHTSAAPSVTGGYEAFITDSLGNSGMIRVLAEDNSAHTFFFSNKYELGVVNHDSVATKLSGPDGGSELTLDTLNTGIDSALILSSPYLVPLTGLSEDVAQGGRAHSVAVSPEVALAGVNSIAIWYNESDLDVGNGFVGDESDLQIYRWNDQTLQWDIIGGYVDTTFSYVASSITELGTYAAFTTNIVTDVDDDEHGDILPYRFELSQNYPNPFNPVTTIEYSLPRRSNVKIDVFNLLGQKVRTLVDREESAGTYSVAWDGTRSSGETVSTGIYFYRFQADDHVETKKMLLLK